MKSLTEIAYDVGCTKGRNGYCWLYEPFLHHLRDRDGVELLEIGLSAGGPELGGDIDRAVANAPSLDLWLTYFRDVHVTGFDICDFQQFHDHRFTFVRGDSGSIEDLERLAALGKQFDIIIDDGSHASFHQQLMLAKLFPLLRPGGFYIIEDLNWTPERYEKELPKSPKTRFFLSEFFHRGSFLPTAGVSAEDAAFLNQHVNSTMLFDNGYINAHKRSACQRFGLRYSPGGRFVAWRNNRGLWRLLDPFFWRYLSRAVWNAFAGEECVARDYVQLAVLQRKVSVAPS